MSVTLSHLTPEYRADCQVKCSECNSIQFFECRCCRSWKTTHVPKYTCLNNKGNIVYELRIDFHNLLHNFCSNYNYEVVCKIPRVNEPDGYLFTRIEPRFGEPIIFKKSYAATTYYNEKFNLSDSNLYFGIRRLNKHEDEICMSTLLRTVSTFQNMDDKDSKVILQAKNGQITEHKCILSQYSEVFQAMFAHEMREKQDGVVGILDIETKVLKKMVDYLYTGKFENISGMIGELFKVAHRYQIQELCRRCEGYYVFNVLPSNDNIVEILELVDLYELKELKNSAENFVRCHQKALSILPRYISKVPM